jgi:hypothetical protein
MEILLLLSIRKERILLYKRTLQEEYTTTKQLISKCCRCH